MKNVDQIRQILKQILTMSKTEPLTVADNVYKRLATNALALLPCETCDGLKVVPHGNWTSKPCPDCQSKPKLENPE